MHHQPQSIILIGLKFDKVIPATKRAKLNEAIAFRHPLKGFGAERAPLQPLGQLRGQGLATMTICRHALMQL